MTAAPAGERDGIWQRAGLRFTALAERWAPEPLGFALVATVLVFGAGLAVGAPPAALVEAWGNGIWALLITTAQIALLVIAGCVVASAPAGRRTIRRVASLARTPRSAVALVALLAMASAWLHWGVSLIVPALVARELARRVRGVDYRALAAASFVGLGTVWAHGLSGTAALQMAGANPMAATLRDLIAQGGAVPNGIVGLRHTIFLGQGVAAVVVEVAWVALLMWLVAPVERARGAAELGIDLAALDTADEREPHADLAVGWSERLERSPLWLPPLLALGGAFLVLRTWGAEGGLGALDLNTLNLALLLSGFALHGTPARFLGAARVAAPLVGPMLVLFPLYAGVAGMVGDTALSGRIARLFLARASAATLPAAVALYSAALGLLVPSGAARWSLEAPHLIAAAHQLKVHLGWVVTAYDLGEAPANLVSPFWMLPTLGLLGLRARDVMGYTLLVLLALLPLALLLLTALLPTLRYPL